MMKFSRFPLLLSLLVAGGFQGVCAPSGSEGGSISASLSSGDLVYLQGSTLHHFDQSQLAHVRYFAIYYSASWCPPCRQFTPTLVNFYDEVKKDNPQFELILVCRDQTPVEMEKYMAKDEMHWPALAFAKGRTHKVLNQYAGSGIPDLVVVDAQGKVLLDSYKDKTYIGPKSVLHDLKKLLADNPPTAEEIAAAKNAATRPATSSNASTTGATGSTDFDKFFKKPVQTPKP